MLHACLAAEVGVAFLGSRSLVSDLVQLRLYYSTYLACTCTTVRSSPSRGGLGLVKTGTESALGPLLQHAGGQVDTAGENQIKPNQITSPQLKSEKVKGCSRQALTCQGGRVDGTRNGARETWCELALVVQVPCEVPGQVPGARSRPPPPRPVITWPARQNRKDVSDLYLLSAHSVPWAAMGCHAMPCQKDSTSNHTMAAARGVGWASSP